MRFLAQEGVPSSTTTYKVDQEAKGRRVGYARPW